MTLAANVPESFVQALAEAGAELRANFQSVQPANPEDQLKGPIQRILAAAAEGVVTRTEAQVASIGRPDISVEVARLLCGFVELKAPGKGARPERFRDRDREQWSKFKALPNLIYTDGIEWALYRSGEIVEKPIRFSGDLTIDGSEAFTPEDAARLHTLLLYFFSWNPEVPKRADELAKLLAPLCRLLRDEVTLALENPDSSLCQVAHEWRQLLFPDADDDQFADAYAQTVTYALLLARLSGETHLATESAAARLESGHGVLAAVLRNLTHPLARREIETAVSVLERVIAEVDPAALAERGDPWLYFYEDFLAAYDRKLRNDRGVYYTPVEVIEAQVRLVAEKLAAAPFHKRMSYADDGVTFLDPAAGTAAYPLAAVQFSMDQVAAEWGAEHVAARATEAAKNIHAFELLVGPYAVAHLRLTKIIQDYGGRLPAEGVHVYLADTLDDPVAEPPSQIPLSLRALSDDHRRAQRIKADTRIMVCMGNPPYDREERAPGSDDPAPRRGGWVRFGPEGNATEDDQNASDTRGILLDFVEPARGAGQSVHVKNLYNDYVYFWRWALWKVFETTEQPGIVSFITASSYLRGPGFVGMRQKMREDLDELWIIDLEGDQLGARKTENVFAIRTPVAIAIGVRSGTPRPEFPARVRYTRIVGSREEKLARLKGITSFNDLAWQDCYSGWTEPFLPSGIGDYFSWPLLTDLLPWQYSGVQVKRTWPIAETPELLQRRWQELLQQPVQKRGELMQEKARKAAGRYRSLFNPSELLPSITSLPPNAPPLPPVRFGFRSFDRQWILPDNRLIERPREPLWRAHSERQVYMTSLLTGVLGFGPAATVAANIPDLHHFRGSFGGKDAIPLWRDAQATRPNVAAGLLETLSQRLSVPVYAEDLFAYAYALLATPAYVEHFSEELTVPGPRLPITSDAALFRDVVAAGRRLIYLHTFGERFAPEGQPHGQVPRGRARTIREIPVGSDRYPHSYLYEEGSRVLRVGDGEFGPVESFVFEFSVSGYKVIPSWLAYRMREGAGRTSSPLDSLRPETWTATMTEELLSLIWVLEATVAAQPELAALLGRVLASSLIFAAELPAPTAADRAAPSGEPSGDEADEATSYTPDFWRQRESRLKKVTPQEEDSTLVVREMRDEP